MSIAHAKDECLYSSLMQEFTQSFLAMCNKVIKVNETVNEWIIVDESIKFSEKPSEQAIESIIQLIACCYDLDFYLF